MAIGTPTTIGTNTLDGDAVTLTTSATVPSGALVVVCVGWGNDVARTLSSVDGGGLTWVIDHQQPFSGALEWGFAVVSAQAPAGLASSTVLSTTFSGTIFGSLIAGSYTTGLDTVAPVDVHDGAGGSSDPWDTTATTTTVADTLVIGGCFRNGANTNTPSGGATELHDFQLPVEDWAQCTEYKILSATASTSLTGTWTVAAGVPDWSAAFVAYKAASGVATDTTTRRYQIRRSRMTSW